MDHSTMWVATTHHELHWLLPWYYRGYRLPRRNKDWVKHEKVHEKPIYFISDSQTKIEATAIFFVRSLEGFNVIAITIKKKSATNATGLSIASNLLNGWLTIGSGPLSQGSVDQDKNDEGEEKLRNNINQQG